MAFDLTVWTHTGGVTAVSSYHPGVCVCACVCFQGVPLKIWLLLALAEFPSTPNCFRFSFLLQLFVVELNWTTGPA